MDKVPNALDLCEDKLVQENRDSLDGWKMPGGGLETTDTGTWPSHGWR